MIVGEDYREGAELRVSGLRCVPESGRRAILTIEELSCRDARVIAVLGPNGSGKTTLLRVLSGALPHDGEVRLYGQPVWHRGKPGCGPGREYFLVQEPSRNVLTPLSVEENIQVALEGGRLDSGLVHRALSDWRLKLPGLAKAERTPARYLSGGEKQALGLMLALARCPQLLLLDEHTASLDEKNKVICAQLVWECLRAKGRVILWVTQDLYLARRFADAFIVLREGEIITGDLPREMGAVDHEGLMALCFPEHGI